MDLTGVYGRFRLSVAYILAWNFLFKLVWEKSLISAEICDSESVRTLYDWMKYSYDHIHSGLGGTQCVLHWEVGSKF